MQSSDSDVFGGECGSESRQQRLQTASTLLAALGNSTASRQAVAAATSALCRFCLGDFDSQDVTERLQVVR